MSRTMNLLQARTLMALFGVVVATITGCGDSVDTSEEGEDQSALGPDEPLCEVGTTTSYKTSDGQDGTTECVDSDNGPVWSECAGNGSAASTPLVFAFSNERVAFDTRQGGAFDLAGRQMSVATDW